MIKMMDLLTLKNHKIDIIHRATFRDYNIKCIREFLTNEEKRYAMGGRVYKYSPV